MISQLIYTNDSGIPAYTLMRGDTAVLRAGLSLSFDGIRADIIKRGARYCSLEIGRLSGLRQQSSLNNPKKVMPVTVLSPVGEPAGSFTLQKAHGYSYFECSVSDYNFTVYVVVLEKEALKISIYSDGKQVALLEDSSPQQPDSYLYDITSVDELSAEMAALFCMFFDISIYLPFGEFQFAHRARRFEITENAELKAKYNVDFTLTLENDKFFGAIEASDYVSHKDSATAELDIDAINSLLRRPHRKKAVAPAPEADTKPAPAEPENAQAELSDIVETLPPDDAPSPAGDSMPQ